MRSLPRFSCSLVARLLAAGALVLAGLLVGTGFAFAEDLVTLSGTTYRHVSPVRVEPDGVTWRHDTGMVKVDFADCPEPIRLTYHYDAARAAAYRDAQDAARRQTDEAAQKLVRTHEERQRERVQITLQNTSEASSPTGGGTIFALRRRLDADSTAAAAVIDAQARDRKAAHDLLTKDDGTVWDRRLWAIPCMLLGGYNPGNAFEPGANLNPHEFKASLHHRPGAFAPTAMQDSFNTPMYMSRSYYEDVERSEAFARGVPLGAR